MNQVHVMFRFPSLVIVQLVIAALGGDRAHASDSVPQEITVELPGDAFMEFVWIEPGSFTMGAPEEEPGRLAAEGPQRQVTISQGFYLGKYEITQSQWQSVMGTGGTEKWRGRYVQIHPEHPAVYISWEDVQTFIKTLNFLHGTKEPGGPLYRLPSEAEWEYTARAGTTARWSFGDDETELGDHAWYEANTWSTGTKYAQPIGARLPNPWGLHDMHGNVWEWVQDWHSAEYYGITAGIASGSVVDPRGPSAGDTRVLRGGGFSDVAKGLRSACRFRHLPSARGYSMGARLVRTR